MKKQLHIVALFLLGCFAIPAIAAEKKDPETPEAAIRAAAVDFVAAFNKGDAKEIAALWIAGGDHIDADGNHYVGREAIQAEYETFFQKRPGSTIQITVDSVRRVGADSAIEDGRAEVTSHSSDAPALSKYVAIHVKKNGKWLLASVRGTRVESSSKQTQLASLEWLVGEWIAEHEGVRLDVASRWIANNSFIERSYAVTNRGQLTSSGRQIIGWDPETQSVRSWVFNSDGGHAIGDWSQRQGSWVVRTTGVTGSGESTTATNIITRVSDQTLSWKSIDRSIGGKPLSDTGETMLERK